MIRTTNLIPDVLKLTSRPRHHRSPGNGRWNHRTISGRLGISLMVSTSLLWGCTGSTTDPRPSPNSAEAIEWHASAGPFTPRKALVQTDNDTAFASKLALVEGARESVDMLYYVYADDYSSAVLSEALLKAIKRGVRVRLLADYSKNYSDLDYFTMLEDEARSSPGSLEVRFYNRPTRNIIRDAIFVTMGCSDLEERGEASCDEKKFAAIEAALDAEGLPPEKNISNLNMANSGLFLSGWYAKKPEVMALAIFLGQGIGVADLARLPETVGMSLDDVQTLAKTYWRAQNGPLFQRAKNKLHLTLFYLTHFGEINDLRATLSSLLPIQEQRRNRNWRDWDHITDYQHQKLLLVDGEKAQLGGRNIGDPYHLRPGPLLGEDHWFSDTDIYVELSDTDGAAFREAFDRLWSFDRMVATITEVRLHAPNELVANWDVFEAAEESCEQVAEEVREACIDSTFSANARSLKQRIADRSKSMRKKATKYHETYPQTPPLPNPPPTFELDKLDKEARLAYLENLPFLKELPQVERTRIYGAEGLAEADHGKDFHHIWRMQLENICSGATAASPRRVLLHNAYYMPPANLLRAAAGLMGGELDCRHVTVQILTNSTRTSNISIINLFALHGIKAFIDHHQEASDPETGARFEFYEYVDSSDHPNFTLHSKVSVIGDDVSIGSANADVRSYMMDSNNGILIHDAPRFREEYLAMVDALIADPQRVRDLGAILKSRPREELKEEQVAVFDRMVDPFLGSLPKEIRDLAQGLFLRILDTVYDLTREVLQGDEDAIDRYNRLFKLL